MLVKQVKDTEVYQTLALASSVSHYLMGITVTSLRSLSHAAALHIKLPRCLSIITVGFRIPLQFLVWPNSPSTPGTLMHKLKTRPTTLFGLSYCQPVPEKGTP